MRCWDTHTDGHAHRSGNGENATISNVLQLEKQGGGLGRRCKGHASLQYILWSLDLKRSGRGRGCSHVCLTNASVTGWSPAVWAKKWSEENIHSLWLRSIFGGVEESDCATARTRDCTVSDADACTAASYCVYIYMTVWHNHTLGVCLDDSVVVVVVCFFLFVFFQQQTHK